MEWCHILCPCSMTRWSYVSRFLIPAHCSLVHVCPPVFPPRIISMLLPTALCSVLHAPSSQLTALLGFGAVPHIAKLCARNSASMIFGGACVAQWGWYMCRHAAPIALTALQSGSFTTTGEYSGIEGMFSCSGNDKSMIGSMLGCIMH